MSRAEKFYAEYKEIKDQLKWQLIPKKKEYDIILNFIASRVDVKASESESKQTLYNWKKRYTVQLIGDKQRLFHGKKEVIFYEQLYDLLHRSHVERTGHGGRDAMKKDLTDYYGLGQRIIITYLKGCKECELKKARVRKSVVIKPILEKDYAERMQLDLIDMQGQRDGPFSWIMVAQEAIPIAAQMEQIFAQFGPPAMLHTDNGKEFRNRHLQKLCEDWNVKMVHGLPRKSSTQGSVERANCDIENIIMTWENHFKRNDWAGNLHLFQLMKNNRFHRSLNKTPAVFGRRVHSLPAFAAEFALDEEEDETVPNENMEEAVAGVLDDVLELVGDIEGEEVVEMEQEDEIENVEPGPSDIERRAQTQQMYREYVQQVQAKRAEKMISASNARYGNVEVGTPVRIPVDAVDRGKTDPRNVLGVILANDVGRYTIGTREGVLPHQFPRTAFAITASQHVTPEDVPSCSVGLRMAIKASSQHGGQGHAHCTCKSGCGTKKCGCRQSGKMCNSRCHNSLNCTNK